MSEGNRGGETRLDLLLYLTAAISYVGLGVYHRWLLNWIIGPLWVIAWLQLVPALGRRLRGSTRPGSSRPTS